MAKLTGNVPYALFPEDSGQCDAIVKQHSCKCSCSESQWWAAKRPCFPREKCSSGCPHLLYWIHILITHRGCRKSQSGEEQVSEGSYKLNGLSPRDSFQHIIQAGDPEENGLQELNSLQQMRALSFALINTFFTDVNLHSSGSNVDWKRRGLWGCFG